MSHKSFINSFGASTSPLPLTGILIADFSRVLAGPYATMLLGDLGGEVIKVESPGGDDTRSWIPPVRQDGVSTYFSAINRNKKSIAMDFNDSEDLAVAQRLAARRHRRRKLQAGQPPSLRPRVPEESRGWSW